MFDRSTLRGGMKVRSADGDKLGEIIDVSDESIVVEKGFFFPKDHVIPASAISEVRDDEVWLSIRKEDLGRFDLAQVTDTTTTTTTGMGVGTGEYADVDERRRGDARLTGETGYGTSGLPGTREEEQRLQLAEEQVDATKRVKNAGEVRVRKEVVTETKHVDVPVTREEVHVERVPVQHAGANVDPNAFKDDQQTISMPIREEEVEITKKPVVREEIRLKKTATQQERRADVEVRREEARVEGEDVKRTDGDVDPTRGDPKF